MGEGGATTVRDGSARRSKRPGQRRSHTRTWLRLAASLPTALALALPLAGLTATLQPQPAFATPDDQPCVAANSVLPDTKSAREATAAKAAAQWFPASEVAMATAVAGAESSWNTTAVNKAANGNYGLWQINSVHEKLLDAKSWRNPVDNAWMAYQVWDAADGTKGDGRGSWKPWSVYNSSSYKAYLRTASTQTDDAAICVEAKPSSAVKIATWNVLASNAKGRIASGVSELTQTADVFGLQEMGSGSDRATAAKAAEGFTMTTDRTAVPIFYRTDKYTAIAQGRERAFAAGQKVEGYSGQSSKTKDKWVTWVQLQDNASSETFYVVNTHLLVGAYNKTKQTKKNDRRVALYERQLATVTDLVDGFQANGTSVYVTCDCNVNYDTDVKPVAEMSDHGLTANWQHLDGKPTIGKKTRLDYVWSNRAPTEQLVGEKNGSDHSSVVVTYPPSMGQSSTMTPVVGSTTQEIYSMRTVTDPSSGQTYLVPIPTGRVGKVLEKALDQVGDRWAYGSDGPDAWDCSGLTAGVWETGGVSLPHQSEAQEKKLKNVSLDQAQPGDILWREGYTAIYLGLVGNEHLMVGAAKSQGAVVIQTAEQTDIVTALRPTS